MDSIKLNVDVDTAAVEAAIQVVERLSAVVERAAAALKMLGGSPHGGIEIRAVGDIISCTIAPALDEDLIVSDEPLTPEEQARIDAAWETHKTAAPAEPVARVINDNQPGNTAIIEVLCTPPTLVVGTELFAR